MPPQRTALRWPTLSACWPQSCSLSSRHARSGGDSPSFSQRSQRHRCGKYLGSRGNVPRWNPPSSGHGKSIGSTDFGEKLQHLPTVLPRSTCPPGEKGSTGTIIQNLCLRAERKAIGPVTTAKQLTIRIRPQDTSPVSNGDLLILLKRQLAQEHSRLAEQQPHLPNYRCVRRHLQTPRRTKSKSQTYSTTPTVFRQVPNPSIPSIPLSRPYRRLLGFSDVLNCLAQRSSMALPYRKPETIRETIRK